MSGGACPRISRACAPSGPLSRRLKRPRASATSSQTTLSALVKSARRQTPRQVDPSALATLLRVAARFSPPEPIPIPGGFWAQSLANCAGFGSSSVDERGGLRTWAALPWSPLALSLGTWPDSGTRLMNRAIPLAGSRPSLCSELCCCCHAAATRTRGRGRFITWSIARC